MDRLHSVVCWLLLATGAGVMNGCVQHGGNGEVPRRPNILFAIADDQSYPHTSAYGSPVFRTPAFDRVAEKGVLFTHAFVAAPQCSPSRAAILTGRPIWQLEEAGTHGSYFPRKYPVFTEALADAGYFVGYTGKAWSPGNWKDAGWKQNPVGPAYNTEEFATVPYSGISKTDYAANFERFLRERSSGQPFFFWFGCREPHRVYEYGSGKQAGLDTAGIHLPAFLPVDDTVRSDFLDYALEVSWFDQQLQKMIDLLEQIGELENTIIIVTADNGMAFPHAKASLHEYGIHVPLAACGPGIGRAGHREPGLVSLIDLAPTILDLTGTPAPAGMAGHTLLPLLSAESASLVPARDFILAGRERHTHARPDNLGYPARALRTRDYLYIRNLKPERWPMGDPPPGTSPVNTGGTFKPIVWGFEDIDDSPAKERVLKSRRNRPDLYQLVVGKRPGEELYAITTDPDCMHNLAADPAYRRILDELGEKLERQLNAEGDPRMGPDGDIFESYPRFGPMRPFEGFRQQGAYNPAYQLLTTDNNKE